MTRYGRLLDDILRKNRHASGQEILGFLDGELAPREMDWVRRHIEGCWSCRTASERTVQTVAGFVDHRQRALSRKAETWPDGRRSLAARLRDLPSPPQASTIPRGLFAALPVFALLAVAFLVFRLTSAAPVSAAAVLENARRAEMSPAARGGLVAYRKLAVRRSGPSAPSLSAVYEVWADGKTSRVRHSGAQPLLAEIEAVFAANGRSKPPLSASGFASWRGNAARKIDEILRGKRAGADVLTVKTRIEGPLAADGIREGRIVIRAIDWAPLAESISVGDEQLEYEFEAVEMRTVDRASMPDTVPAPSMSALRLPAPLPTSLVEKSAPRAGLLEEIAAHYALHRLGACLDGAVAIVPRGGEILVEGVVESKQRESEFERAFADIPGVRVRLQSADTAALPAGAQPEAAGNIVTVKSKQPPLSHRLREYFRAHPAEGTDAERAAKLANRALSYARELRQNVWAVRRLMERFDESAELTHSAPSRWLLEVMVRDHARTLEAEAAALKEFLAPFLAFMGFPMEPVDAETAQSSYVPWQNSSAAVFEVQQEVETMIHDLFASAGEALPPEDTAMRLGARLTVLQQQTRRLAGSLSNPPPQEIIP